MLLLWCGPVLLFISQACLCYKSSLASLSSENSVLNLPAISRESRTMVPWSAKSDYITNRNKSIALNPPVYPRISSNGGSSFKKSTSINKGPMRKGAISLRASRRNQETRGKIVTALAKLSEAQPRTGVVLVGALAALEFVLSKVVWIGITGALLFLLKLMSVGSMVLIG